MIKVPPATRHPKNCGHNVIINLGKSKKGVTKDINVCLDCHAGMCDFEDHVLENIMYCSDHYTSPNTCGKCSHHTTGEK